MPMASDHTTVALAARRRSLHRTSDRTAPAAIAFDRPTALDRPTTLERSTTLDRSTPRPRVQVSFNEFTGTMSWRTLGQPAYGTGPHHRAKSTPHPRTPEEAPWSARAAALRSAGLDPSRAPANGAAPIPTHPAVVRAALGVDAAALTPEQRQRHLARIGTLRSAVTADLAHGTGMPTAVASRLRSTTATPAHAHALTAHRATTVVSRPSTFTTQPGPAAGPRR
ncbi:hypothetical protein [Streptomyces ipomoeae]|nr:hypothetical protein [Streptomyces ipomoeae]